MILFCLSNIYLNEYNIIKVGDYALPIKYDVISAMPSKGNTAAPRITLVCLINV